VTVPEHPSSSGWLTERRVVALAAGIILAHAVLGWLGRIPGVSYSNDDAVYLVLADALRHGTYRDLYLVAAPWHTQYPPGWPALLAVVGWVTGNSIPAAFLLVVLLSSGGLAAFFAGARRVLPDGLALVALTAAAWSTAVLAPSGRLMSEAAYFAASMVALWALSSPEVPKRRMALVLVAALLAAHVRTIGLALLVAIGAVWFLARHWRRFGVATTVFLVGFGPWLAWTFLGPQKTLGRSYVTDLAAQAEWTGRHGSPVIGFARPALDRMADLRGREIPAVLPFLRITDSPVDNLAWILVLLVCGGSGLVLLWRRWRVVPLYLVGYVGLLTVWAWSTRRFLFPVQPLIWLTLLAGAWAVWQRARWAGGTLLALLLVPVTLQGWPQVVRFVETGIQCDRDVQYESPTCYTPEQLGFFAAARYARDSLPPGVVLVDREAAFAWHSGRTVEHSIEWVRGVAPDRVLEALRSSRVEYVLLAGLTAHDQLEMPALLLPRCAGLRVVREFGEATVLLQLVPEGSGDSCAALQTLEERARARRVPRR